MMKQATDQVIVNFFENTSEELNKFIQEISIERLIAAKELILASEKNGGRVHVTGIGKPGHVAEYIASLLSSTGTPAYFLDGTEAIHGSAGQVRAEDIVLSISNSGETEELIKTVRTLKKNGAKIISITGKKNSWLAKNSDCFLFAGVEKEGDTLNKPPRASILAEVLILQSLSVLLQEEKAITNKEYVKWHPGGTLGQSISVNE
ncbi:arabinose-5-phosphate isomerase [Enterococcus sp. DIV0212c]|uniref:KpsF/GutQ family sugar-phosphate isomerase n=1 Tax=Enterococcus sp. DIV0212c TaxID=2230867 RepID=UPI001A9B85CC|nr:SIS domain-containing protein [Enterococcus sp. DIV0212c]MBO1353490.1 SIS domain-containing protein [Enterococcus sp. DIV0212c]